MLVCGGGRRFPAEAQDRLRQRRAADLRRHQSDGQPRRTTTGCSTRRPGSGPITKRGGEIWTIDPVLTRDGEPVHPPHRAYPGKDYAILAWVVRELIDGGPCTPKQPVTVWRSCVRRSRAIDRAKAAEIAGVTEQDLEDLLAAIRRKGRVATETGTGIRMSAGANLTAVVLLADHDPDGLDEREGRCLVPSRLLPAVRGLGEPHGAADASCRGRMCAPT